MSIKTILDGASGPTTSRLFNKAYGGPPQTVFMRNDAAPGDLVAGDTAVVQISHDKGVSWVDMVKDTNLVLLQVGNNHESIYGPGLYRLNVTGVAGGTISAYFI